MVFRITHDLGGSPEENEKRHKRRQAKKASTPRKVRQRFPETMIMQVKARKPRGKFDLLDLAGKLVPDVTCLDSVLAQLLQPGDTVMVQTNKINRNDLYIRNAAPQATEASEGITEGPVVPGLLITGLWVQHFGWWWQPGHNRQPVQRLIIEPPASQEYTNETLVKELFGDLTILHFRHIVSFEIDGELFQDGESIRVWPPPTSDGGEGFDFMGYGTQSPRPDLHPELTEPHTTLLLFGGVFPTEVFTADYQVRPPAVETFYEMPESSDAAQHALRLSGLVMFPDADQQIVAALNPVYQVAGAVTTVSSRQQDIEFTEDEPELPALQPVGNTFQTEFEPINPPTLISQSLNFPPELNSAYQVYEVGPTTFGLSLRGNTNQDVNIWFLYLFNHTPSFTQTFEADGLTDTFKIDHFGSELEYFLPDGAHTHDKWEILAFNSLPTVDGVPDVGATFQGGSIILSSVPPEGAQVEVDVEMYEVGDSSHNFEDAFSFNLNGLQGDFVLDVVYAESDGVAQNDLIYFQNPVVRFLYNFEDGDEMQINYQYSQSLGDRFTAAAVRIYEKNVQSTNVSILETPLPTPIDMNPIDPETGERVRGLGNVSRGHLYYEPATDSYTQATPGGISWRSRRPLNTAPSTLPTPAAHFTLTAWPADGVSQDTRLVEEFDPPLVNVPRRPQPWYGFSAVGPYAIQGSWNRVGGEGDTDFFLHLWKRNQTSFVWDNHASRSVKDLAEAPGAGTLRILAGGRTDVYNVVQFDRASTDGPSLTRNYEAWIVPAAWYVYHPPEEDPPSLERGLLDAGLTLNAISSHTGQLEAQFTIKSSATELAPKFTDFTKSRDKIITDTAARVNVIIDKYVNDNPIYWPPGSGPDPAPPHAGGIMWAAQARFHAVNGVGSAYFIFEQVVGYLGEVTLDIRYPGNPTLFGGDSVSHPHSPHRGYLPLPLHMDEDNNLYFGVDMPVWRRNMDETVGGAFREKIVDAQVQHFDAVPDTSSPPISQPLWLLNEAGDICFVENVLSVTTNGVTEQGATFWSTISGIAELVKRIAWTRPSTYNGIVTDPETGNERASYTWHAADVTTRWRIPELNPETNATYSATYSVVKGFEYPTFLGFQGSPMPYAGMKVVDYSPKWRKGLDVIHRQLLFKVNYNPETKQFTEIWRKDVTQYTTPNDSDWQEFVVPLSQPKGGAREVRQVGRFIFVVHAFWSVAPENPTGFIDCIMLEAYLNGPSAPGTPLRVEIPNSRRQGDDWNAGTFQRIEVDQDAVGREHVTIWHSRTTVNLPVVTEHYITTLHFKDNEAEAPDVLVEPVNIVSPDEQHVPLYRDILLARIGAAYYWLRDLTNQIKRKLV